MHNIIFVPFAYLEGAECGSNVKQKRKAKAIYIENSFVALMSIKLKTKNAEVALVTNCDIGDYYDLFVNNGIKILKYDFDFYNFPKKYKYCLAFYKICALKHILELGYKNYLMLDADIFCKKDLGDVFNNIGEDVMIYHRENSTLPFISLLKNDYKMGILCNNRLPRAAGGFFACNSLSGKKFINNCDIIYSVMIKNNIVVPYGDEFITTNAVAMMENVNFLGNKYLCICETGVYRDIPSRNILDNINLIHLPAEKNSGMRKLFKYYITRHSFPDVEKIYKIIHINKMPCISKLKKYIKIILRKHI